MKLRERTRGDTRMRCLPFLPAARPFAASARTQHHAHAKLGLIGGEEPWVAGVKLGEVIQTGAPPLNSRKLPLPPALHRLSMTDSSLSRQGCATQQVAETCRQRDPNGVSTLDIPQPPQYPRLPTSPAHFWLSGLNTRSSLQGLWNQRATLAGSSVPSVPLPSRASPISLHSPFAHPNLFPQGPGIHHHTGLLGARG